MYLFNIGRVLVLIYESRASFLCARDAAVS